MAEATSPSIFSFLAHAQLQSVLQTDWRGRPYVRILGLIQVAFQQYALGISLGHARGGQIAPILQLVFSRTQLQSEIASLRAACLKDVETRMQRYRQLTNAKPESLQSLFIRTELV